MVATPLRISPSGPDATLADFANLNLAEIIRYGNVQNVVDPMPLDIVLDDDTTFLSILTSGAGQIRTITGSTLGRLLIVMLFNFGTKTFVHNAAPGQFRSLICPGLVNFSASIRDCFFLVGADADGWQVISAPLGIARVGPNQLTPFAAASAGSGVPYQIVHTFAPGASQDVTVPNTGNPAVTITDVALITTTPVVGSTCQLRSATGGGGVALSSALSSAATGTTRNSVAALSTVATAGTIVLRRSDVGVGGTVILTVVPG